MITKNKKRILAIIFFCLSIISALLILINKFLPNPNSIYKYVVWSSMFATASLVFLILFLNDKSEPRKNKTKQANAIPLNKNRTIEDIINDNNLEPYDKFVDWCSICN